MTLSLSQSLIQSASLVSQGAEAKVYKSRISQTSPPILLKYRFQKHYRHPNLDVNLTRSRIAGEARALLKCLRSGVNVPGIRMVDSTAGVLGIEWIEGQSVRKLLPGGAAEDDGPEDVDDAALGVGVDGLVAPEPANTSTASSLNTYGLSIDELMRFIGIEIAKMHRIDVIHGDLTTSNMMLRHLESTSTAELILIDFGLSYQSTLTEDKAVDLYVLERAFSSTHPDSEPMFNSVLAAYADTMGKDWPAIKNRLDDVRLRGRKRSMVG